MEKVTCHSQGYEPAERRLRKRRTRCQCFEASAGLRPSIGGFSLIEILVVVSIISILGGISLPVLSRVQRSARVMQCLVHTRQTTGAEIMYAEDHRSRFAESVATIWHPSGRCDSYEPSTLVNWENEPREHRNQSEYLGEYLSDPEFLHCPEAPGKPRYLKEAWDAGDDWRRGHWLMGTKCLWRNFKGWAEDFSEIEGPKTMYERGGGKVLVSCILNYGRHGQARLMGSAYFKGSHRERPSTKSNFLWPELWIGNVAEDGFEATMATVRIQAGYVDGHVESRNASESMGVWVTSDPFPVVGGPSPRGMYFLPLGGLR